LADSRIDEKIAFRKDATSTYIPRPVDQTLVERAFRGRVTALSQAFASQLAHLAPLAIARAK
jgi:hypothetical protein